MEHTIDECLSYVLSVTRYLKRGDFQAILLAILIELGFPVHRDGFEFLMEAILLKREYPRMRLSGIYDEIIHRSGEVVGYNQIEQSIRSIIRIAWERRDHEIWLYFFSEDEIGKKYPSNKVFISQMAYLAKLLSSCEEVTL